MLLWLTVQPAGVHIRRRQCRNGMIIPGRVRNVNRVSGRFNHRHRRRRSGGVASVSVSVSTAAAAVFAGKATFPVVLLRRRRRSWGRQSDDSSGRDGGNGPWVGVGVEIPASSSFEMLRRRSRRIGGGEDGGAKGAPELDGFG